MAPRRWKHGDMLHCFIQLEFHRQEWKFNNLFVRDYISFNLGNAQHLVTVCSWSLGREKNEQSKCIQWHKKILQMLLEWFFPFIPATTFAISVFTYHTAPCRFKIKSKPWIKLPSHSKPFLKCFSSEKTSLIQKNLWIVIKPSSYSKRRMVNPVMMAI